MKVVYWIIVAPILVMCTIFAVTNSQFVVLDLWPFHYEIQAPLSIVIIVTFILAFLIGATVGRFIGWKRHKYFSKN